MIIILFSFECGTIKEAKDNGWVFNYDQNKKTQNIETVAKLRNI